MLKFVNPPDGRHLQLVHCELETVSLDEYTPEFRKFYEKQDILHTKFHEITKFWLRECSPTVNPLEKHKVSAQSLIEIPLWRVMEDSHHNNGYSIDEFTPLDYLRETIFGITSDSSQCPSMLQPSPITLPSRSLYMMDQFRAKTHTFPTFRGTNGAISRHCLIVGRRKN